jgi:predicted AlkP superfamily pyrophosphatase or phosphodiesterase
MKKILIISSLLISFCAVTFAQKSKQPKLVVGIVVDQMRADYIEKYKSKYSQKGFLRLQSQGFDCRNTNYNYAPTFTGPGHASIYTGTTPILHGIVSNDWYVRKSNDTIYCVYDRNVKSVGGESGPGRMSPNNLLTTTITDELQLTTQGKSKVIGISLKDRGAILPAGRAADAAYWFDGYTGNWITSTWYMTDLPEWVKNFNNKKYPDLYLSKPWNTLLPIDQYTESDVDDSPYEMKFKGEEKPVFPHNLPTFKGTSWDLVRRTPFGNTMTKDLAKEAITAEHMGEDAITDFLCVSFSATDYVGHQFGTNAIELEDTYIRLDKDLEDLFSFLDAKCGKDNYLVFLTADHAAIQNPQSLIDVKLNAGFINARVINDTVIDYLKQQYGTAKYFSCYDNNQVYLNRKAIAEDKLNLEEVQTKVAQYLSNIIEGIYMCVAGETLKNNVSVDPLMVRIKNGYHPERSGDVIVVYAPGWIENLYGGNGKQGTTHGSPYAYDTHVPLLWMGTGIIQGSTTRPINITDIAPTLSFLLNTNLPNANKGFPIYEITK